ncbi:hypothetical protein CerSpe_082930 [Prunus speciosa]
MLSKCRSSSIPAVHFKRPLPFPLTHRPVSFQTNTNAPNHADPFHQTSSSFSPSRLGAFTQVHESTHFNDPHSAHSFCSNALKVSAKMGFLREGKQLHGHVVKLGLYNVQSLQIQILNVYVKCKDFNNAQRLFGEMRKRNVVAWNTLISGLVNCWGNYESKLYLGFSYFRRMLLEAVGPDDITFNGLLRVCIDLNDVEIGRQLHCFVVKLGFGSNCFVGSALVDLYAKHGLVEDARCAFDFVLYRDLVLWNVMVYCYASNSLAKGAFGVFNLMRLEGVKGDEFTFSSLLSSCRTLGSCKPGKQIHGIIIREAFDSDVLVSSALVDMYAKNDDIGDASKAFDAMSIRNVVSWTTIIVGCGLHGKEKEAIGLLREMFREHLYPDELTLASIVSSCGNVSSASELMQVHAYMVKFGFHFFSSIVNSLITAYSKCGSISSASKCFNLVVEPDLVTWTSLICAYAFHGLAEEATEVFEKMLAYDIMPDQIAFLAVLSACSHGGLIQKGLHYFKLMSNDYQNFPDSEHYTCLIDLLGRAGLLDEAFMALTTMPIEPDPSALGAFMGACKVHGNIELAKWAAEKLFALEPNKPVNYTLMSNIYSSQGHWGEVSRVRKMMRHSCVYKAPGCSWVEIGGGICTFVSGDESHPQAPEVYAMLGLLLRLMKEKSLCL